MRERGDLHCLHEPFMYDYYLNPDRTRSTRNMPFFKPEADHPRDFDSIVKMILTLAETTPVFFKDMSYYVIPYLETHAEFFKKIENTFLIRDPAASIASYYALDNAVTLEEIGYEAQWVHAETLINNDIACRVIETERIQTHPEAEISKWWETLAIPFTKNAFDWSDNIPDDWKQVETWHAATLANDKIKIRKPQDSDREQERYAEAVAQAPHLADYLTHHTRYYRRLKKIDQ